MRAPLPLLALAFAAGLVAACVDETPPDDLPLDDSPNDAQTGKPKGTRNPSRGSSSALPGDPSSPSPKGGGTPGSPSSSPAPPSSAPPASPPPSSTGTGQPPPPRLTPFNRVDIRYPVDAGLYITQCSLDGKTQLVWLTSASGTDVSSRWADPKAMQQPNVFGGCGAMVSGEYPLVFTGLASGDLPAGTYVVKCSAPGEGHVYRITGQLEGHPAATWAYAEKHASCVASP